MKPTARFSNFKHMCELDSFDPGENVTLYRRTRAKVSEIVAAKNFVFTLTVNGVCMCCDRNTKQFVCCVNQSPDEIIRSLFYNKESDAMILVSVYRVDNYRSLFCKSIKLEHIAASEVDKGTPIFQGEVLTYPGFVEFDDVNRKVLTFSAEASKYKVWALKDYKMLYEIDGSRLRPLYGGETKISPGVMLLGFEPSETELLCRVLDIETGEVTKELKLPLRPGKKIDFIEQFNENLMLKLKDGHLKIFNVSTDSVIEVPEFKTPNAFIFLYDYRLFLTFMEEAVCVWNFRGELVSRLEDHQAWQPEGNTNNIYITTQQDVIISHCPPTNNRPGTINISNILTGKRLARIEAEQLDSVTSLYYNEEHGELYTGTVDGKLAIWGN